MSGAEKGATAEPSTWSSYGPAGVSVSDLYHAVIDSLPDVTVFVVDTDLRYRLFGGAAVSRAGWRPEELIGLRPSAILGEEDGGPLEEHLRAALAASAGSPGSVNCAPPRSG